jgi:hypothetical protein
MRYTVTTNKSMCDGYVKDFLTWPEVTGFLRNGLDSHVTRCNVYKFSVNGRCLAHKIVNMSNICKVAYSLRDTVLRESE